jgi:hypothetical protein
MIYWIKKNKAIVFLGIFLVCVSLDPRITILLFTSIFQFMAIVGLTEQIRKYKTAQKGPVVQGIMFNIRKISPLEESTDNYECDVEFEMPFTKEKQVIVYRFSSLLFPESGKEINVWVNEKSPESSIVTGEYNAYGIYSMIILGLVSIGLFILDAILILQIIDHYKIA